MLIGLAAKSGILIVEFAKERWAKGMRLLESGTEGAWLRFHPVMMTSVAVILRLLPLVIATGLSRLARRDVDTPVFGGMLFASIIWIFAIPALSVIFQVDPQAVSPLTAAGDETGRGKATGRASGMTKRSNRGVRMRTSRWLSALAVCAAALPPLARADVSQDNFLLRNTGDLIAVCSAAQSDPLYTAATNFCQGFVLGVFRVLNEEDVARRSRRLFCPPDPTPSRNEAIDAFVKWAITTPGQADALPADGIASYMSQTYPCPHAAAASRRTSK